MSEDEISERQTTRYANMVTTLCDVRGCDRRYIRIDLDRLDPRLPAGYRAAGERLKTLATDPKILTLTGLTGRGKTALAVAACRWFWEHDRQYVFYTTALSYLDRWRSQSWGAQDRFRDKFQKARDLVVIDEMQSRATDNAPWLESQFAELIDKRYANGRPTLLISNILPGNLISDLGEATWRRIKGKRSENVIVTDWGLIDDIDLENRR